MAEAMEPQDGKTRKRGGGKPAGRPDAKKVKATIHLTVEADQRLAIHAKMLDVDKSKLVEQLIRDHLKRFVVSDREKKDAPPEPPAAGRGEAA